MGHAIGAYKNVVFSALGKSRLCNVPKMYIIARTIGAQEEPMDRP